LAIPVAALLAVQNVLAQRRPLPGAGGGGGWPTTGLAGARDPGDFIRYICDVGFWIFTFLLIITVIIVLWAAYQYLTSGGDSEKVKNATKTLTWAAAAVVVALLARVFPIIVAGIVGVRGGIAQC
jgi:hypothetical protein